MRMKTEDGQILVLCHYPIHSGQGEQAPGSYNIRMKEEGIFRYDVGVDANAMAPVALGDILAWFKDADAQVPEGL